MTVVNGTKSPRLGSADRRLLRTLIVGAGVAGRALARDLAGAPSSGWSRSASSTTTRASSSSPTSPLLGRLDRVAEIAIQEDIDVVVMAIPGLDSDLFTKVTQAASLAGASVRYLPSFVAALERRVVGSDMRWLDVGQLIGRDEVHVVSAAAAAVVKDKVVLVTGAGGSIGSELCRQVFGFEPRRLVMLDHDESNLHRLQLELWGRASSRTTTAASLTSAIAPGSTRSSRTSGRTWSSTPPRTSTCRCWSSTRARRSSPTSPAPRTCCGPP